MTKEIWKKIPNYPKYSISTEGKIRSSSGKILKASFGGRYHVVTLYRNGKAWTAKVHRLVLTAFIGHPPTSKHECAHWDGDRINNRLSNLRWATRLENEQDKDRHGRRPRGKSHRQSWDPSVVLRGEQHGMAKLNNNVVKSLRRKYSSKKLRWKTYFRLGESYGVSSASIRNAIIGTTWRHIS